jgi:phosphoglycolate phosphatase
MMCEDFNAPPLIVFDLDGTLVDTAPDLIGTLDVIFERNGIPRLAYEDARNMVGGGARKLIQRGLAAEGCPVPGADLDRLVQEFIAHYADHIAERSRPFPGLGAALDRLAAAGCRFAVCTNKLEWLARRLLDALGLTGRFVAICGGDTFGMQKPHPQVLRRTVASAGVKGSPVMVGDSITDVSLARAARIPIIAVAYGYTEIPPHDLGADRVIEALSDLPQAVFDLVGRIAQPEAS